MAAAVGQGAEAAAILDHDDAHSAGRDRMPLPVTQVGFRPTASQSCGPDWNALVSTPTPMA